jgi:hypothetical protein
MILVAVRHAAPTTAHHETSKCDSPYETKITVRHPKCPGFEFKLHQVNDSSESNQGTDHLVSQPMNQTILMSTPTKQAFTIPHPQSLAGSADITMIAQMPITDDSRAKNVVIHLRNG